MTDTDGGQGKDLPGPDEDGTAATPSGSFGELLERHLSGAIEPVLSDLGRQMQQTVHQHMEGAGDQEETLYRETRQMPTHRGEGTSAPGQSTSRQAPNPDEVQTPQVPARMGEDSQPRYAVVIATMAKPGLALNPVHTAEMWRHHLADVFRDTKGFRGASVLGNPGGNVGLTITLWDREVDVVAEGILDKITPEEREGFLGEPRVETYEVIFSA